MTRGIRNNNPMNIRRSTSLWVGEVRNGTDREFEQFHEMTDTLENIKIMMRLWTKPKP